MGTLSCTTEPKLSMIRLKDSKHGTTKSAEQSSLMTIIREEDRLLGLRMIKTLISNPDTEIRSTKHPIDRTASIQIKTEIQTEIDSTLRTDQIILGPMDPTTASKLSITSMLDQRILILNTTKISTEQQSAYTQLSPIHR